MTLDLLLPAIGSDVQAACRLVLDDGAPVGTSFRYGHHIFPSIKKVFLCGRL